MTLETATTITETRPIDPAVERSRALVAGLSDLALLVTNHPAVAERGARVEMRVYLSDDKWDGLLAELASYDLTDDETGSRFHRRVVNFGDHVRVYLVGPEKAVCPNCGRS